MPVEHMQKEAAEDTVRVMVQSGQAEGGEAVRTEGRGGRMVWHARCWTNGGATSWRV